MANKNIFAGPGPSNPDVQKSIYDLSHAYNGTFRLGRAYPCLVYDAPGGSSFRIKPKMAFDVQPMTFPIQTPIRAHMSYYKIPKRILMKSFKDFYGDHGNHKMPWIARATGWATTGSLADYMGIPTEKAEVETEGYQSVKIGKIVNAGSYSQTLGSSPLSISQILFPTTADISTQHCLFGRFTENLYADSPIFHFDIYHQIPFEISSNSISQLVGKSLFTHLLDYDDANDTRSITEMVNLMLLSGSQYRYTVRGNARFDYIPCSELAELSATGFTIPVNECNQVVDSGYRDIDDNPITYYRSRVYIRFSETLVTVFNRLVNDVNVKLFLGVRWDNVLWPFFGTQSHWMSTGMPEFENFSRGSGSVTEDDPPVTKLAFDMDIKLKTWGVSNQCFYRGQVAKMNNNTAVFSTSDIAVRPRIPINALPFRAYEFIHNYFFRVERITPFIKNGEAAYNEFLTNDGDGADNSTPVDFFNVPYEYDLFTTCLKTPQFGNAPLIGITTNDLTNTGILHMQQLDAEGHPVNPGANYDIAVSLGQNGNIMAINNYDEVADKNSVLRLKDAIKWGISINDLRNVNCLQRWKERHAKAGDLYQDLVYEFQGTHPPIGEEFPEYLGGVTSAMNVGKIINQTGNSHTDVKLGEFAGSGNFRAQGSKIRCFCTEDSYIMGILWFSATPTYSQMLPRHFTKFDLLEFHNSQFNNIGLQPVYVHQIAPLQLSEGHEADVFGYNRPYSEYVSMQDEVHGQFRTTMSDFLMQRIFGSAPQLNEDFLYIKPEDLTDVFSVNINDDKIFGQIWFDIKAKLPIPHFAIPRII